MINFLNILAVVFLIIALINIYVIYRAFSDPLNQGWIGLSRKLGLNILYDALKIPLSIVVTSVCWLVSRLFD